MPNRMSARQKDVFWERYENNESGCWVWTGATKHGYGVVMVGGRGKQRSIQAHRVAYTLAIGPIPDGQHACHTCDVTLCINPDHLFLGSQVDNMQDCAKKLRVPGAKLSSEQVREIRAQSSADHRDLGKRYGVSHSTIGRILRGAAYAWVEA